MAAVNNRQEEKALRFLIYGRTGWVGGLLGELCEKQGITYAYGDARLEDRQQIVADITAFRPSHVLNAAGQMGRPTMDWCESHKLETLRSNMIAPLTLADVCHLHGLPCVYYGAGCIYTYDPQHPLGSGKGFTEHDPSNFSGSFYAKSKASMQDLLKDYDNVLLLRMRMLVSSDLSNPRNFIPKISRYERVVNIPNSMTVLDEMLPMSFELIKREKRGVWNFTNEGTASHNELLEMWKEYVDPNYTWKTFSYEEQAKVIVAGRSNLELDVSKLKKEFPELLPLKESVLKYVFLKFNVGKQSQLNN